jgi:PhzF family phenazine biosynthesis protein
VAVPIFLVDAFTTVPFAGNPAGVCLLPSWRSDRWMQAIAAEMNVAETAFVVRDGSAYGLRWFTPAVEVPLCGHATLAAAHVLYGSGQDDGRIVFSTMSGELRAARVGDGIELDFPASPVERCDAPPDLVSGLGVTLMFVGRTSQPECGEARYLCELKDEQTVRSVTPDIARLRAVPGNVIITARATGDYAIVSRFFAPRVGIDEDPVTGSAHCSLAPYWASRLGRSHFRAWQASARGGEIEITLRDDRVGLAGHAVTVWSGACQV